MPKIVQLLHFHIKFYDMYILLINSITKDEHPIDGITYQFLYPVFFIFSHEYDLFTEIDRPISLSGNKLDLLYQRIKEQLYVLINTLYSEPSNRSMSKKPGLYTKVYFDDKKYIVDYTTYAPGRLIYVINNRLNFINSVRERAGEVLLVYKRGSILGSWR